MKTAMWKMVGIGVVLGLFCLMVTAEIRYAVINLWENSPGGWASSINNNGQIVGIAPDNTGHGYATLFDPTGDGNNKNLGTLGGTESEAISINNNGQILGYATDSAGHWYFTLFDATGNGNNINLNTLINSSSGGNLRHIAGINDNGWIVGNGINPQGHQALAFLLIPVPEPGTILLAICGIVLTRRKR